MLTVHHINKVEVCKLWNDPRGCGNGGTHCVKGRLHACDVKLASGGACGQTTHNRVNHSDKSHGMSEKR